MHAAIVGVKSWPWLPHRLPSGPPRSPARVVVGDEDRVVAGVLGRLDLLREEALAPLQDDDLLLARVGREADAGGRQSNGAGLSVPSALTSGQP